MTTEINGSALADNRELWGYVLSVGAIHPGGLRQVMEMDCRIRFDNDKEKMARMTLRDEVQIFKEKLLIIRAQQMNVRALMLFRTRPLFSSNQPNIREFLQAS
jgi:hypothetical protein